MNRDFSPPQDGEGLSPPSAGRGWVEFIRLMTTPSVSPPTWGRILFADYEFYMGKYPITQAQWRVLMGENPSVFKNNPNHPVENVSWDDCQKFAKSLSRLERGFFRLPSEAEWEYACRAGRETRFYWGDDLNYKEINKYCWYGENSKETTHGVGEKEPNQWKLYDMSGNVEEWCEDDWHENYVGAPDDGRAWIDSPRGSNRVLRGGCWGDDARYCRSAFRYRYTPVYRNFLMGFRVIFSRT